MKWLIYKHTNKINGKVYIGQTKQDPKKRWQNGLGYVHCTKFFAAIRKYGWDNFEHEIIMSNIPSQELANLWEQFWVEQYKHHTELYNLTEGGMSHEMSEETKAKIGKAHRGKIVSENTRQKLRDANLEYLKTHTNSFKGKHHSDKSKKLLSESHKGLIAGKKNPFYGSCRTGKLNPVSKKVLCTETEKIYDCITDVERELKINHSLISRCCKGKCKTAGGYHWKYVEE